MSKPSKPSKPYDVGYCKTPVHTRFQPGKSGNPKGGRNRKKNPLELIDKVLGMKVNVSDGRSVQRDSILEAGLRSIAAKMVKGDLKAMQLVLNLVEQARALEPGQDPRAIGADDLAIIERYVARLQGGPEDSQPKTEVDPNDDGQET